MPDMSNEQLAIHVINACKSFQKDRQALQAINVRIDKGECVGLLGASGSGKSTLLRSLCGLERLDGVDSEIQLWGQSLQKSGKLNTDVRQLRTHIGIIFQQFNLVGRMDVLTNVMTGLLPHIPLHRSLLGWFTPEEKFKALKALHSVGLSEQAMQRPRPSREVNSSVPPLPAHWCKARAFCWPTNLWPRSILSPPAGSWTCCASYKENKA